MRPVDATPDAAPRRAVLWLLLDFLALQLSVRLMFETLVSLGPWWRSSILGRDQIQFPYEFPAIIVAIVVGVLVVLPLLRRVSSGETAADLGLRGTVDRRAWAAGTSVAAVGVGIAALMGLVLPEMTMEVWRTLGIRSTEDVLLFVFVVAPIFGAVAEEIMYRGFMQRGLQRVHLGWGAIAVIVTFAGAHAHQGIISVMFFVLPLAVLFTAARQLDPSLGPLIVAHLVIDVAIFAGFFVCEVHPQWHAEVCAGALAVSGTALLATAGAFKALLVETRGWMSTLRGQALRHIPWVLAFVIGAGIIVMVVQMSRLPLPLPVAWGVLGAIIVGQALRRRRQGSVG